MAFALCGRSSPFEPGETLEVVDKVGQADLEASAGNADGAHDQPHPVLLAGEHMLETKFSEATCARTLERRALARAIRSGSGRLGQRRWWMLLVNMPFSRNASFFFDR